MKLRCVILSTGWSIRCGQPATFKLEGGVVCCTQHLGKAVRERQATQHQDDPVEVWVLTPT